MLALWHDCANRCVCLWHDCANWCVFVRVSLRLWYEWNVDLWALLSKCSYVCIRFLGIWCRFSVWKMFDTLAIGHVTWMSRVYDQSTYMHTYMHTCWHTDLLRWHDRTHENSHHLCTCTCRQLSRRRTRIKSHLLALFACIHAAYASASKHTHTHTHTCWSKNNQSSFTCHVRMHTRSACICQHMLITLLVCRRRGSNSLRTSRWRFARIKIVLSLRSRLCVTRYCAFQP